MSVEGKVLTAANVEELAASLGTLSSEDLARLRALFCPTAHAASPPDLGVRDILQTWIENEPNPTKEKFLKLRTRFGESELCQEKGNRVRDVAKNPILLYHR